MRNSKRQGGEPHHVVKVDEGVVDGDNLAVSLGLVEVGSTGHEATDTAEAVDTDRDGPGTREDEGECQPTTTAETDERIFGQVQGRLRFERDAGA